MELIFSTLHTAMRLMIPYLLISLGGLLCYKSGIFNLALEGFAILGCFAAVAAAKVTGNVLLAIIFSMLITSVMGAVFAFFVLKFKVNPIVASLAFNLIGEGLSRYLLSSFFGVSGRLVLDASLELPVHNVPILKNIPILGDVFNNLTSLAYIAFLLVIVMHVVMYKTKFGFQTRIVGLNETAAISVGVNANRVRYIGLILGSAICGLAGAQLALSVRMFNVGMTGGRGWTAVVILMMADSRPVQTLLLSLLFGVADALIMKLSGQSVASQLLATIPYLLAFVITLIPLLTKRMRIANIRHNARRAFLISNEKTSLNSAFTTFSNNNAEGKE